MSLKLISLFNRRYLSKFVCVFLVSLTGCGGDDFTDLQKFIQEVHSRPKGAIDPLPETKVVEPFIFKPDGLRDPFQQVENALAANGPDVVGGTGIRPDTERRKEELEAYSLDTLRMVGTLIDFNGLWGLIKAKDGTIHSVQVGHHMGQNYGKVIRILDDKIELMEIVPDVKPGTWREQQATIALGG